MAKSRGLPNGRLLSIPHAVYDTDKYAALPNAAIRLLYDLARQYNGFNNGSQCASFKLLKNRGWQSKSNLERATRLLLDAGFIEITRQGGRHRATLYGFTWHPIHECKDKQGQHKLDARPTKLAAGTWKDDPKN